MHSVNSLAKIRICVGIFLDLSMLANHFNYSYFLNIIYKRLKNPI
jgi:hypothetical protein